MQSCSFCASVRSLRVSRARYVRTACGRTFSTAARAQASAVKEGNDVQARSQSPGSPSLNGGRFRLAIIGAGPAGFYAASRLLSMPGSENTTIDMYEELPVPFGLVRYGVAPDHPEVKNCIHKFEETAVDKRFRFFGNCRVDGRQYTPSQGPVNSPDQQSMVIPLSFLRPYYHSMLFTYGASHDRSLGPSVRNDSSCQLHNVHSARSFVHWYNGHPHSPFYSGEASMDLSNLRKATVIGQGNVALDCARILLSGSDARSIARLSKTDVPESVLDTLSRSSVQSVNIVGRRGPLQFAGTTKELRELVTLDQGHVSFHMSPSDASLVNEGLEQIGSLASSGGHMDNARMKKRLLGLMQKASVGDVPSANKKWSLTFCRSPVALLGPGGADEGPVKSVKWELNDLLPPSTSMLPSDKQPDPASFMARGNGQTAIEETDFLLKSVGYRSVGIEGLPFDERKGVVRNVNGRVYTADGEKLPGLYVSGWLARGPNGVIATTMYDAFDAAETIAADLSQTSFSPVPDLPRLDEQDFGNQKVVSWSEWQAIDAEERRRGQKLGKEREKFVTVASMLSVL